MNKVFYMACEPREDIFISMFNFLETYIQKDTLLPDTLQSFSYSFLNIDSS